MELIIDLLKQLASSLTPADMIIIVLLVLVLTFFTTQATVKLVRRNKTSLIGKVFGLSEEAAELSEIRSHLVSLTTSTTESSARIITALELMHGDAKARNDLDAQSFAQLQNYRAELVAMTSEVKREFDDIKHQMKMHDSHADASSAAMRDTINRILEVVNRINVDLQKIDEFARSAIPEFRSYHKEITKDLAELSRDVALVERSVQTQINTVNAVKLR